MPLDWLTFGDLKNRLVRFFKSPNIKFYRSAIITAMRSLKLSPASLLLLLSLSACGLLQFRLEASPAQLTPPAAPSLPPVSPSPTPFPSSSPTQTPTPQSAFELRWHPNGPLYAGDTLSLEILPPPGDWAGRTVQVRLPSDPDASPLGSAAFDSFGLGRRLQATLWWFWDTAGLPAGAYPLEFQVLPNGPAWQASIDLLPSALRPAAESQATWRTAESQCCQVHYITGTAAERDLDLLLELVDQRAAALSQRLEVPLEEKIPIVLLPRVLGHGGFTASEIAVSYLDRNYAGRAADLVLNHEIAHWLDGKAEADFRPTILVEGLAVYLTGGHFKPEPLLARAAALLPPLPGCQPTPSSDPTAPAGGLDRWIPLAELADDFYPSQHEIGYLQAGALVEYLVDTWGWPAFLTFYRDIPRQPGQPAAENSSATAEQSASLDAALQVHYGFGLAELEQRLLAYLAAQPLTPQIVEDLRLSVAYYDSLRRYQVLLDPSAYFLYAWLADTAQMRQRGIVADYFRHPQQPENLALELLFVSADAALRAGNLERTDSLLQAIQVVLERLEAGDGRPFTADPQAAEMYALVLAVQQAGYLPERAEITGGHARVWASAPGPRWLELHLARTSGVWEILVDLTGNPPGNFPVSQRVKSETPSRTSPFSAAVLHPLKGGAKLNF